MFVCFLSVTKHDQLQAWLASDDDDDDVDDNIGDDQGEDDDDNLLLREVALGTKDLDNIPAKQL